MNRTAEFHDQIRSVYREHRQALFTYALSLTRNRAAAEDAVHTAVCRLLQRGRPPRNLQPYLFRAVRNAAVDGWRRQGAREEPLFDTGRAASEDTGQWLQLEQCLFRLGAVEREVIVLKVWSGFTFREIGDLLGMPANTAASHHRRGLEKMKSMMEEEGR